MNKPFLKLLVMFAAGSCFAAGSAFAEPRVLSGAILDNISGEQGILVSGGTAPEAAFLSAYDERDTEVTREILRRNNVTDYPVESTDMVITRTHTLQVGQASGKTFNDLIDEATPGRLPQFFLDYKKDELHPDVDLSW